MRTYHLVTLGCKVNPYETQQIKEGSLRAGFCEAAESGPTDCRHATAERPGNSRLFGQLVTGQAQRLKKCELVANRYSAPNQASVFVSDCLESPTTYRATKDCAVQNSPA